MQVPPLPLTSASLALRKTCMHSPSTNCPQFFRGFSGCHEPPLDFISRVKQRCSVSAHHVLLGSKTNGLYLQKGFLLKSRHESWRRIPQRSVALHFFRTSAELSPSDESEKAKSAAAASDERERSSLQFVSSFREAWPYIQGHRGSTFVVVLGSEVTVDRDLTDSVLQDIALLHGLGVRIVLVPGTHLQIDELLVERHVEPRYSGAYRITDGPALDAAMEAAGRVRLDVEAKLSRGVSIPVLRRHGENNRWHEAGISVASGNYVAAKRRGVLNGVDFGYTGEVRKVDVPRMRERLDSGSIVMLSNLGYNSIGEVLNCNVYEVATACAMGLNADKLLFMLTGPVLDQRERTIPYMTMNQAVNFIRECAEESELAAKYVDALPSVPGPPRGAVPVDRGNNGSNGEWRANESLTATSTGGGLVSNGQKGLAVSGRNGQDVSYIPQLAAAVYACKGGVRRVHLLDSTSEGALLLELYTRDGVGCMVSSDMYEGTRAARLTDIPGIMALLEPLETAGVLVQRSAEKIEEELNTFTVVERDGTIIACASLVEYGDDKCGELGAFVVSPECRGQGRGDTLLDYVENLAADKGLKMLFILTTRTAEWFEQRGFSVCKPDRIPEAKQKRIDPSRGSKCFMKELRSVNPDRWLPISQNTVRLAAQVISETTPKR